MENRVEIIKKIVKFHPSLGQEKGYSWYRGGMADTGAWNWEKMIEEPNQVLQEFLNELEAQQLEGELERERQNKLRKELGDEEYARRSTIVSRFAMEKWLKDEERALMWGTTMPEQLHWIDYYNDPSHYWNKK